MDCCEFSAELRIWDARNEDGWAFLSVPPEESEEIRAYSACQPRAGFRSVRVSVTIGRSTWHPRGRVGGSSRGNRTLQRKLPFPWRRLLGHRSSPHRSAT
jgi:hypothetical protein